MVPRIFVDAVKIQLPHHLVVAFQQLDKVVVPIKQNARDAAAGIETPSLFQQVQQFVL